MNKKPMIASSTGKYTLSIFLAALLLSVNIAEAKEVIGIHERVKLNHSGLVFNAKIDTGAKNSSLNSKDIKLISKNGNTWVKFKVSDRDGKAMTLEKPLERFVSIKRKKADPQERPVIMLAICYGGTLKEVEVNLVDRSNFDYQMLIGRSFLSGDFVVDVEKSYTAEPGCEK